MTTLYSNTSVKLTCPLDGAILTEKNNQLCCEGGHCFDIARSGYVNLLPVQYKKSKDPGDSKAMIDARHRFLGAGYYDVVANTLNNIIGRRLSTDQHYTILDAGCGEGFYLHHCVRFIQRSMSNIFISALGLDISKPAIVQAAKSYKNITWVVGTNKTPPVVNHTIDFVICMFGFYDLSAFAKILKSGGYVILADPGPDHLIELRSVIYPYIKTSKIHDDILPHKLVDKVLVKYKINLNDNAIMDLLLMTPHLYRASKEGKDAASKLKEIEVTVDIVFRVLQIGV